MSEATHCKIKECMNSWGQIVDSKTNEMKPETSTATKHLPWRPDYDDEVVLCTEMQLDRTNTRANVYLHTACVMLSPLVTL